MSKYEKPVANDANMMVRETVGELELPVAAAMDYDPPVYSLAEMFARGTARLRASGPVFDSEESRKQSKCAKEFVL